jgi:hypothetical protein
VPFGEIIFSWMTMLLFVVLTYQSYVSSLDGEDPSSIPPASQYSSSFAEITPPKSLLATIACPLIFVPEKPDDGRLRKSASVIAVFAPKILFTFMDDSIWTSIMGGGDVGIDVDV